MEKNWPFFYSTMDMLDMVITKVDPEISKVYEDKLADKKLKLVGKKLRSQFDAFEKIKQNDNTRGNFKTKKRYLDHL